MPIYVIAFSVVRAALAAACVVGVACQPDCPPLILYTAPFLAGASAVQSAADISAAVAARAR